VVARVTCLVLAASAVLACATPAVPVADLRGSGDGPSNVIALPAGTYRIDWSGWDDVPPKDGCLLGLTLELTAEKPPEPGRGLRVMPVPPKLTYRPVAAGAAVQGQAAPVKLVGGFYLVRAEGSCAWQVRLTPIPAVPNR
jgi:hypothetical protein